MDSTKYLPTKKIIYFVKYYYISSIESIYCKTTATVDVGSLNDKICKQKKIEDITVESHYLEVYRTVAKF